MEAGSILRPEAIPSGSPGGSRHLPQPPGSSGHPGRPALGSRSALVSVRYLPARVAISRAFRSHGWSVLESADTEELGAVLERLPHAVVFLEAPERPDPGWSRELARIQESGTRVIGVASRLRGATGDPWRGLEAVPHLLFPFQEAELERLIESLA